MSLRAPVAALGSLLAVTASAGTLSVQERIDTRDYPSVFQAWNPADNLKPEPPDVTLARHDLAFVSPEFFGLKWNNARHGLADGFTEASIGRARARRAELLKLNPHLVFLAEIRYRDAAESYLPEDSPWWKREHGERVVGWKEGHYYLLDFSNPQFRAQVAKQAQAAVATGVFDGVMLDWWKDDADRLALIREVRHAVGEAALILANANDHTTPLTADYINGFFMECYRSETPRDWDRIATTLRWAEGHLRRPHIDCVETWYHTSRNDLNLMRATTAMALTMSDGYCLFADPDPLPTPDHLHDWYPYWDKSLGRPLEAGHARKDGAWERSFSKGVVLYNPLGHAAVKVHFEAPRTRLSTGETGTDFTVPGCDGELFLTPAS